MSTIAERVLQLEEKLEYLERCIEHALTLTVARAHTTRGDRPELMLKRDWSKWGEGKSTRVSDLEVLLTNYQNAQAELHIATQLAVSAQQRADDAMVAATKSRYALTEHFERLMGERRAKARGEL